ncbi:MAG: secondary thiamine-phosphate synthase enzyme YjbQ [archaeon]
MELRVSSEKREQAIDITHLIADAVSKLNVKSGFCILWLPHGTAALSINENADDNIEIDTLKALDKMVPLHAGYLHDQIDNNAAAHIKASVIGTNLTIPIENSRMTLGTWQGIFLYEFDGPRDRRIVVKVIKT